MTSLRCGTSPNVLPLVGPTQDGYRHSATRIRRSGVCTGRVADVTTDQQFGPPRPRPRPVVLAVDEGGPDAEAAPNEAFWQADPPEVRTALRLKLRSVDDRHDRAAYSRRFLEWSQPDSNRLPPGCDTRATSGVTLVRLVEAVLTCPLFSHVLSVW